MKDYPAGHSMDSTWFAIDESGEIAYFETDEGGAMPEEGFALGGEAGSDAPFDEMDMALVVLRKWAETDPELAALLPESGEELGRWVDWEDTYAFLRSVGIYVYGIGAHDAVPYERGPVPSQPLKVSDLPEEMRKWVSQGQLPIAFRGAQRIAPGEFVDVHSWSGVWFDTDGEVHSIHDDEDPGEDVESWEPDEFPQLDDYYSAEPIKKEAMAEFLKAGKAQEEKFAREYAEQKAFEKQVTRGGLLSSIKRLFGRS